MRLIDNTLFVCNLRINLNICQNERKIDFKEKEIGELLSSARLFHHATKPWNSPKI